MAFVGYVAGVAITNLFVGFVMGRVLTRPEPSPERRLNPLADPADRKNPKSTADARPTAEAGDQPSSEEPASNSAPRKTERSDGSWAGIATEVLDRSAKLQTSLQAILGSIEALGENAAAEEAQRLAQQAHGEATAWFSEAEQISAEFSAALKKMPDGRSITDRFERIMCEQLAQTETSASNLLMIDWSASVAAGVGQLSSEMKRLLEASTEMRTKLQTLIDLAYQMRSAS